MRLSVIIPTLNEARYIRRLVDHLFENAASVDLEVIVVDGGSTDDTVSIAQTTPATVVSIEQKGRARQMNFGAGKARGEVLYFVHADTLPPASYFQDIEKSVSSGYALGRYQTRFASNNWLLKMNAFFTRFDWFVCYGGDQTLFIRKDLFDSIGGYRSNMSLMEEYELVERARKQARYQVMPGAALVSARKYDQNSWLQVQQANYRIVQLYKKGCSQEMLVAAYKKFLRT